MSRDTLLPTIFEHLNRHMNNNNEVAELAKCFEILSSMLENMYNNAEYQSQILAHLIFVLPVISNSIEPLKDHKIFLTAVTVYLNIFHLLSPNVFTSWVVKLSPDQFKVCFLIKLFSSLNFILILILSSM